MKNIYFIILSIIVIFYIIYSVRKSKLSIKESFWWFIASIAMLLLSIFPYSIDSLASLLNISYPPSLLFVLCIIFLVCIIFSNCKKISSQQEKIIELEQHIALIEHQIEKKENKK